MQPLPKLKNTVKRNEDKWTRPLMDAGWTVLPSVFLERQDALGLDPIDINIILHLAKHWWYKDSPPYPSKKTIAQRMGVDESTVRRRIAQMEKAGFIQRRFRTRQDGGQNTNEYLFDGLIKEATPYAQEMIEESKKRRIDKQARLKSKKPHLAVVNQADND
jgi:predicted transcriptional regulator